MTRPRESTERLTWPKRTGRAFTHGTVSGYNNHGCRCDECYEAWKTSPGAQRNFEIKRAVADKRWSA